MWLGAYLGREKNTTSSMQLWFSIHVSFTFGVSGNMFEVVMSNI